MAEEDTRGGGGFGFGFFVGGLIGLLAGAYLASGPGRDQVESLRTRTIELTSDPESPVRRAMQEGIAAARRRRAEIETEGGSGAAGAPPITTG